MCGEFQSVIFTLSLRICQKVAFIMNAKWNRVQVYLVSILLTLGYMVGVRNVHH